MSPRVKILNVASAFHLICPLLSKYLDCLFYYDISIAYLILYAWNEILSALLRYQECLFYYYIQTWTSFLLPALVRYQECLFSYDIWSVFLFMISEPDIIIKQANMPTLLWYMECLPYYDTCLEAVSKCLCYYDIPLRLPY